MAKTIKLSDIIKLDRLYVEIFSEEDSDYVDWKIVRDNEKSIDKILNKITKDKEEQSKIYDTIVHGFCDNDYVPMCNQLRKLGYTVLEGK